MARLFTQGAVSVSDRDADRLDVCALDGALLAQLDGDAAQRLSKILDRWAKSRKKARR